MDKQVILEAIQELEVESPTLENVQELATLYIVWDHLDRAKDKPDVIESYKPYCEVKRKYQMHEATEDNVLDCMHLVCEELMDLILLLHSNSDMRRERKMIQTMVNKLHENLSK